MTTTVPFVAGVATCGGVGAGWVWNVTVQVQDGVSSQTFTVKVAGNTVATLTGSAPYGPIALVGTDTLTVSASGGSSGQFVTLTGDVQPYTPPPPLPPEEGGLVYNILDYGADPTGRQDSYPAFEAAVAAAWQTIGTVFAPPGIYTLSQPVIVQPTTAGDSLAPSIIAFGSGGITETSTTSSVLLRPSDSFPSGEYLIAFLPYSSAYQLTGYECGGFSVSGTSPNGTRLAAGIGILNGRQAYWHDVSVGQTITPAPVKTKTGNDYGAFNVWQPGSPGGFCGFNRITVSDSGLDAFYCNAEESVWDQCRFIDAGRYGINGGDASMLFTNLAMDTSAQSQINGAANCNFIGTTTFGSATNGPTIQLYDGGMAHFIGCQLHGPNGGNDNSGVIINVLGTASATFEGCAFQPLANTVHLVSAQSGYTGAIRIIGGSISGSFTGETLFNEGTTGIISARDLIGYNPTGPQAAPAIPASGTVLTNPFPFDCTVYVNGGTVTAVDIGGTATGQIAGAFPVPAGETITLTYSVAPTWTWFGN
jgi:hypothetical protein